MLTINVKASELLKNYFFDNFQNEMMKEKPSDPHLLILVDLQRMISPNLKNAEEGALALRLHSLVYLSTIDLKNLNQKIYYYKVVEALNFVTEYVFEEIRLQRTDLIDIYTRRVYIIEDFKRIIGSRPPL